MARWIHKVKVKGLFTEMEDHASVQASMNAIADVLSKEVSFYLFNLKPFRNIPKGDAVFGPIDYANKLLDQMYDFADYHRIWIE